MPVMQGNAGIFWPMAGLMLWTCLILLQIPIRRFRAFFAGRVGRDDFQYGEASSVPADVVLPNRVFMNLLEAPVMFYIACIVLYLIQGVTPLVLGTAWLYAGLRVAHSLIYLTYNHVVHRFAVFACSNVVLVFLLVLLCVQLAA